MTQISPTAAARPVVVYDGECRFCIDQIERIRHLDRASRFEYVPRQQAGLVERFPVLAQSDFNTGMRLILTDGQVFVGADSLYQIARRLPAVSMIAWLYCLPGIKQAARLVYAWIAANRRRLGRSCEAGACRPGKPATKA